MKFLVLICFISFLACNQGIEYPAGGYDYPRQVADKDTNFYFYPLKDIESKKDSFRDAQDYKVFKPFHEPNLSIRPLDKDKFRFLYEGWQEKTTIISFTEDQITVKQGIPREIYEMDETRLTETEMHNLHLLRKWFPLNANEPKKNPFMRRYLDSLITINPRLLDPAYYRNLEEKIILSPTKPFNYTSRVIPITKKTFLYLVNLFNASGYWSLPHNIECKEPIIDGYDFLLEANTKRKYKIVSASGCPGDTSKFTRACQKLVEYAHIDKEINLVRNDSLVIKDVQLEEIKQPRQKKHQHSSSK